MPKGTSEPQCTCQSRTIEPSVPKEHLVKAICAKCYKPTVSVKTGYKPYEKTENVKRNPKVVNTANQKREWDRQAHKKDLIQPFTYEKGKSVPVENPDFKKHYPEESKQYYSTKEAVQNNLKAKKRTTFY